jgi:hypothetical protein
MDIQVAARTMQAGFDKESRSAHSRIIEALWEVVCSIVSECIEDIECAEEVAEYVLASAWDAIRGVDLDTCSFVTWISSKAVQCAVQVRRCHGLYSLAETIVISWGAQRCSVVNIIPDRHFWADLIEVLSWEEQRVLTLMSESGFSAIEAARQMMRPLDEVIALAQSASRRAESLAGHSTAGRDCACGAASIFGNAS